MYGRPDRQELFRGSSCPNDHRKVDWTRHYQKSGPEFFVTKKDGSILAYVDYWKLNAVNICNSHQLSCMD